MLLEYIAIAIMMRWRPDRGHRHRPGELLGPKTGSKVKEEPYESGILPIGPDEAHASTLLPDRGAFILLTFEVIFFLPCSRVRQLGLFGLLEMLFSWGS